jgi:hypothetical protein
MKTQLSVSNAELFISLITKGLESWLAAGKLVMESLEANPAWAEEVHALYPEVGLETIYAFERIGRMKLHPRLLLSDAPGYRRLRCLPYDLQEKFLKEPVKLLIREGKNWEELNVNAVNLTADQCKQVFTDHEVRSVPAQRAWIESQNMRKLVPFSDAEMPYRIIGKQLVVNAPCRLKVSELARIIAQMEASHS